jgi:hypothetical protein
MTKTHKLWVVWIVAAAVVVTFGFLRGWTTFHKIMLAAVAVLGVLQLAGPALRGRMLRRLKGMSPEERETFLHGLIKKHRRCCGNSLSRMMPDQIIPTGTSTFAEATEDKPVSRQAGIDITCQAWLSSSVATQS